MQYQHGQKKLSGCWPLRYFHFSFFSSVWGTLIHIGHCSLLSGSLALEALLIGVHCKKRYINVQIQYSTNTVHCMHTNKKLCAMCASSHALAHAGVELLKVVRIGTLEKITRKKVYLKCIVFILFYSASHRMSLSEAIRTTAINTVPEFTRRSATGNCK